jgi:hypothetical protein
MSLLKKIIFLVFLGSIGDLSFNQPFVGDRYQALIPEEGVQRRFILRVNPVRFLGPRTRGGFLQPKSVGTVQVQPLDDFVGG